MARIPWRPPARTAFLHSQLGEQITPAGWHNWDRTANEESTFYAEYASSGPGADTSGRVPWSHQLTEESARAYTLENILGGWRPED